MHALSQKYFRSFWRTPWIKGWNSKYVI